MPSAIANFNSIKVRLELIALSDDERRVENFNSIKVRLERSCLKGDKPSNSYF